MDLAPSAIEFVDLRVAVNSYRNIKEDRLTKLTLILWQLRTILLPAERGLFQLIPEEILLSIYQLVTYKLMEDIEITDRHLFRLFEQHGNVNCAGSKIKESSLQNFGRTYFLIK